MIVIITMEGTLSLKMKIMPVSINRKNKKMIDRITLPSLWIRIIRIKN